MDDKYFFILRLTATFWTTKDWGRAHLQADGFCEAHRVHRLADAPQRKAARPPTQHPTLRNCGRRRHFLSFRLRLFARQEVATTNDARNSVIWFGNWLIRRDSQVRKVNDGYGKHRLEILQTQKRNN